MSNKYSLKVVLISKTFCAPHFQGLNGIEIVVYNTYWTVCFAEIILPKSDLYGSRTFTHFCGHNLHTGLGRRQDGHFLFPRRLRPEADPRLRLDLEHIRPTRHQLSYDAAKLLRTKVSGEGMRRALLLTK